jgi:hypothetical protein
MKFRSIALMALAFAGMDKSVSAKVSSGSSYKQALLGTQFSNVNVGNNPIFFPSKTMKINRKRLLKTRK